MVYDIIIIGAGPAGLTSALFAKRQGLNCLVLNDPEKPSNLSIAYRVENYPGFVGSGLNLLKKMKKQVLEIGVKIKDEKVISIYRRKNFFVKTTENEYSSKTLILAMGMQSRKANIKGEKNFLNKGVSYCISCDAPLFKNKNVAVIGGGDSAVKGALALEKIAKNVFLIHRRDQFRAEKISVERLKKSSVNLILNSIVEEIYGKDFLEKIKIKNIKTGETSELSVDGLFIEIGSIPVTELTKNLGIKLDENDFIVVDDEQKTNIQGIFAAGDVTNGETKQIVSAVAQGAIAANSAIKFIEDLKNG